MRNGEAQLDSSDKPPQITVYDGANSIGGNKILLEDGKSALFLDFGLNFKLRDTYFSEFLAPRARRGLLDFLHLGLLPPLQGIYRQDLEPSDIDVWSRVSPSKAVTIQGVLLSHAHLDHSGYISFLREDTPVVASLATSLLSKAIQDTSQASLENEICYTTPKEDKEGYLASGNYRECPFIQRPFLICDCHLPPHQVEHFWSKSPSSRELKHSPLSFGASTVGDLSIRSYPVDHSIFGATAYAVETTAGWVVYTGDLRLHGKFGNLTREFINQARALSPLALICEGTHVEPGETVTEKMVGEKAFEAVKKVQGLIIADFGPRNLERLITFQEIALSCGRQLVVTAKDLYLLWALSLAPQFEEINLDRAILLYQGIRDSKTKWEKELYQEYEAKTVTPHQIKENQNQFILCMSYWDINELIDINPSPDTLYIYSSSEAYDEEQKFDLNRLANWLRLFDIKSVGLPDPVTGKFKPAEKGYHASGHIGGAELLELIQEINPKYVIPVHTHCPDFFKKNLPSHQLRLPQKGLPITLL
ncbi:MAG TPA: MBL fold metallo-hydrolase RNA specificity domain-containing protein, partial [Candidatus Atribacteria bacterium]|nr:MBL fold metallo-hydrolase RNA specificity domain-containing protein [Candidatus Atribacteria bacterium]